VTLFFFFSFADGFMKKGELLEKSTRMLTPEEQAVLDQDWVGKDGTKRKVEVCNLP